MWARSLDLHHHQRAVIRNGASLGEFLHFLEHAVGQIRRRKLGVLFQDRYQPAAAEKLSFAIAGFGESIRIENQNVSLVEFHTPLVIGGIVKNADGKSGTLQLFDATILPEQRLCLPGIGDAQHTASFLPGSKTKRHIAALDATVADQLIQLAQKFRGLKFVRREAAKNSRRNGSVQRRGAAFAADVPERDAQLLRAVGKKIVQVAAHLPRGKNPCGDVQPKIEGGHGTQQRVLQALRSREFALHARFIAGQLFVQARVFQRNRKMRAQDHERLYVVLGEIIRLRALEIQHAHHAPLVNQGDRKFGSRFGIHHEVARILRDVRNTNGLPRRNRCADNAFIGSDAQLSLRALAIFHVQAMAKHVSRFVVKQNSQYLVVDDALYEFSGAAQQFLDIENGICLAAYFVENQQRVGLTANTLEQARVFDSHREPARHQCQNALLIASKIIDVRALNVEHSDRLAFHDQGNNELRSYIVDNIYISRVLANVSHAHRASRSRGGSGDSLPKGNLPVLARLFAVADRKPVIEALRTFVQQHHAKHFIVDKTLHKRRGLLQHFVEVQRRVDLFADFNQRREEFRGHV